VQNVPFTFPNDEMHPSPVETDVEDDVISIVEDEIPDERRDHDEMGVPDELDLPTTDDHSAETNVQHNCTVPPPKK
jgi:hypothetical protein